MSGRSFTRASLLVALLLGLGCKRSAEPPILLGAAASLRNVMPELMTRYRAMHGGPELRATYGASGDLRVQVEAGAPLEAILSASGAPVDDLVRKGMAEPSTRTVFAVNQLVLVGPRGGPRVRFDGLDRLGPGALVAIGHPKSVPVGTYAKKVLEHLGQWDALSGRLVYAGDVAAVLAYARRGEATAAIVYKTDLRGIDDVVLLDEAKPAWGVTPELVGAAVRRPQPSRAAGFLQFLVSPEGRRILQAHGFAPPGGAS